VSGARDSKDPRNWETVPEFWNAIEVALQRGVAARTWYFLREQDAFRAWKRIRWLPAKYGRREWGQVVIWTAHAAWLVARQSGQTHDMYWERPFREVQTIEHAMWRIPRLQYQEAVMAAAPQIWRAFDAYDRQWWAGRALGFEVPPRGGYKRFRLASPFEVLAETHRILMGQPVNPSSPEAISATTHATLMKSPLYSIVPATNLHWGFDGTGNWVFRDWPRPPQAE
jgi:hypothetical protein